jgi:integrase
MNSSSSSSLPVTPEEGALLRLAKSLNARLGRRGKTGFAVVPCPPMAGIWGRPYQVWVGDRRRTLPLSCNEARSYLDGADKALDLREEAAAQRRAAPPAAPFAGRAARAVTEDREIVGVWRAIEALNARLRLRAPDALSVVAISRPVEYVAGNPYELKAGARRLTIPLAATEVFLYLEGMAAALDLQDETSTARRRRPVPVVPVVPAKPGRAPGVKTRREGAPGTRPAPPRQGVAGAVRRRPHPGAEAAAETRRAYVGDLKYFWAWAAVALGLAESYPVAPEVAERFVAENLEGMPAATDLTLVEQGVKTALGRHRPATVERRMASLSAAHRALGAADPCAWPALRAMLAAARTTSAVRPDLPAAATYEVLEALLASCGGDLAGLRDRALLLLAWASGGLRPGSLAKARVEDLSPVRGGYLFRRGAALPAGAAGTGGAGAPVVAILGRAAEALSAWLVAAGIAAGPLFRAVDRFERVGAGPLSPYGVAQLMKRRAERSGLDPAGFGAHSVRSGFGAGSG